MDKVYLFLNAFTLLNLVVLFVMLFFRKNNSITNKLLALIVINPGLNFFTNILVITKVVDYVPFVVFLFQGTSLLYSPLIFAYITLMLGKKYNLFNILNIISAGVILLEFYFAINFYLSPESYRQVFMEGLHTNNYPFEIKVINGFFSLLSLAYLINSYIVIHQHNKAAKSFFSDLERLQIKYTYQYIILHIVLNILMSLCYVVLPTYVVEYLVIPLFINIVYVYLVYYAFNHSAILSNPEYCNLREAMAPFENYKNFMEPLCQEAKEIKKNIGSSKYRLTEVEIEENYNKILDYFEKQKPYLDSSINLTKLSNALNACSHNISLTINVRFNRNFFDLVNSYRIEEAKRMLNDLSNSNLTIEAIGFDSGFNTRMSFYRAFKKHTHMTPSEYLKQKSLIN